LEAAIRVPGTGKPSLVRETQPLLVCHVLDWMKEKASYANHDQE
jgi:hypothetical protein